MLLLIISICFTGSFFLYNTSQKAKLDSNLFIEKWIQSNRITGKLVGCVFLCISLVISILFLGQTAGFISWLLSVIITLSLTITLIPLKILNYKHLTAAALVLLLFQIDII